MANPIVKILRRITGAGAPSSLAEGILAFNKEDQKLFFGIGTAGNPDAAPQAIAGKGAFVDLDSEQTVTGKKNFSTATVSNLPVNANDVVRLSDLQALGSAFNYVGTLAGGSESEPYLLADLTQKDAGDYYKATTAGYFKLGSAAAFYANVGDGLVFNNASGIDKIDNTNSTVAGTTDEIAVTGSTDTGYTVAIAAGFKNSVDGKLAKSSNLSDLTSAPTARTNLGLGSIATQDESLVTVTGGTINGTAIGGTTAAAGSFTTINASGNLVGTGTNSITDFVIDAGTF